MKRLIEDLNEYGETIIAFEEEKHHDLYIRLHKFLTRLEQVDLKELQEALKVMSKYTVDINGIHFGLANSINIIQNLLDIFKEDL